MPSIDRPLSGDVLVFDLAEEHEKAAGSGPRGASGRRARTLVKSGPLRVTLVVLEPGGSIPEHHADGPITIQPVEGSIRFSVTGADHDLAPGQVLAADGGVPHRVSSETGGAFLLTVTQP